MLETLLSLLKGKPNTPPKSVFQEMSDALRPQNPRPAPPKPLNPPPKIKRRERPGL